MTRIFTLINSKHIFWPSSLKVGKLQFVRQLVLYGGGE